MITNSTDFVKEWLFFSRVRYSGDLIAELAAFGAGNG
jgi:hypothetical protein